VAFKRDAVIFARVMSQTRFSPKILQFCVVEVIPNKVHSSLGHRFKSWGMPMPSGTGKGHSQFFGER
jgi:hypothetical protein